MKIKISILFFVVLFSIVGCNKYLQQDPITQVGSNAVFANTSTAYDAIVGVYSRLMGDMGFGSRLSMYYPVDNDETFISNGTGDRFEIAWGSVSASSSSLYDPWKNIFQGIEWANICIVELPKMQLYSSGSAQEQGKLKRMHGEALTLRALLYFEAIKNWGDLPAHFLPASVNATSIPYPKRTNRDSLYEVIINDLKIASDLLPWKGELSTIGEPIDERITKAVAKGLRARIALFRGGFSLRQDSKTMERGSNYLTYYQIAKDECASIMSKGENNLNPSFKDLWKNKVGAHAITDPENELMLQGSTVGTSGFNDSKLGYYNGPKIASPTNTNTGQAGILVLPTYFYRFDSTDERRDVTCAIYGIDADGITKTKVSSSLNMVEGKFRRDWISNPTPPLPPNNGQNFGLKWQILRYSDVLLMFAEAENELNGATFDAYTAINKVRRRGFGKPITLADALVDLPNGYSKTQFFDAIVNERSLEFGGEGIRKYDLLRWNLYATKINQTKALLDQLASTAPTMPAGIGSYTGITLPKQMFFKTGTQADDKTIFANSFYEASPSTAPAGTVAVRWFNITGGSYDVLTIKNRLSRNFLLNHSELLPIPQTARDENANLTQNP
jgi:starch-binding outer membrane protein, SusD/RagB family